MSINNHLSFNKVAPNFEVQSFVPPKCNKTIISKREKAKGKLGFVFLKCQKSWRIIKRLFGKQSIFKFISPFSVEGAEAQQQPHYLRREKSANQSFNNSEFTTSRKGCQISAKASWIKKVK